MADPDELYSGRNVAGTSGHGFQGVHISGHAKAQLGDTYHLGFDNPLRHLPYAANASFNALAKQHEFTCLPGTRVNLLSDIYSWADGQDGRHIFWLSGLAGTGKSTVSRTVARNYYALKRLGASFFFSRGNGDVGHARAFVTSVAVQLAHNIPASRQNISSAVAQCTNIASQSLRDQWYHLVLRPLSKLQQPSSYILIIDALDECDDDDDIRMIVQLLAETRSLQAFVTSRSEEPIRHGFSQVPHVEHQNVVLHIISPSIVDNDIRRFLQHYLRIVAAERNLGADWPGSPIVEQLVRQACGLFIWAATAWRFIRNGKQFTIKRLETILRNHGSTTTAPEKRLDEIYSTVLNASVVSDYIDEEREEQLCILRYILGGVAGLLAPLSVVSLTKLLHLSRRDIEQTLDDLHAILDIPKDHTRPLRLLHPSFRDFIMNKNRCDANFWVDEEQAHRKLFDRCIQLMSDSLKQDICGVGASGILAADLERSQVEQGLPLELQYACLYWVQHLRKSGTQLSSSEQVHHFLQEHFLHWLEALGWLGKVPEGIHAIESLDLLTISRTSPSLSSFIRDSKRFALYNRAAIERAPLQTYSSLMFVPTTSLIRRKFERYIPEWIKTLPQVEGKWSTVLQTLKDQATAVESVAFSPDNKILVSALNNSTIKVYDAGSGAVRHILKGHIDIVRALIFSPNSKTLMSVSNDDTIKLWDIGSGTVQGTLEGFADFFSASRAIAFTPDGKTLALASDNIVKLYNARLGVVQGILEGHTDARDTVEAINFSPDGKTLALVSDKGAVKLCDVGSGAVQEAFTDYAGFLNTSRAVAFSPDGKTLAFASDGIVNIRDAGGSGAVQGMLEGHTDAAGTIEAITFSPDGKTLALVSDGTVKLCDVNSGTSQVTPEYHTEIVNVVAFSPDSKTLVSASYDGTVNLWNANSGTMQHALEGNTEVVWAVSFSPDSKTLVLALDDGMIELWDTGLGILRETLEDRVSTVRAVAFSPDGKTLASASRDNTIKLWDHSRGEVRQTLNIPTDRIFALAFSPDCKTLASASDNGTIKLWDNTLGGVRQAFEGHAYTVQVVAFSSDGKTLASASTDGTVKLWDTDSGKCLSVTNVEQSLNSISFDSSDRYLHTNVGVIEISSLPRWSPASSFVRPQIPKYQGIGLDADGLWITYNSRNLLLVPSEYRSSSSAVSGNAIAIGTSRGKVWICSVQSS